MPVLVATIVPKPGKLEDVEAALKEILPLVHEEPGCEIYALHRGDDRLVMIEKWSDSTALKEHSKGPNLAKLGERLVGLVDGRRDIVTVEAVPTGDPAKGAI
jgi:quinol monooxygenase YgiN